MKVQRGIRTGCSWASAGPEWEEKVVKDAARAVSRRKISKIPGCSVREFELYAVLAGSTAVMREIISKISSSSEILSFSDPSSHVLNTQPTTNLNNLVFLFISIPISYPQ